MTPPRGLGLGLLATGIVCPCHALAWLGGLVLGAPLLEPGVQDGLHAVYVPLAVLGGAGLLRWSQHRRATADGPRSS
jgi:hypothetical protein